MKLKERPSSIIQIKQNNQKNINKLKLNTESLNNILQNDIFSDLFQSEFEIGGNFINYFPKNNILKVMENMNTYQSNMQNNKIKRKTSKSPNHLKSRHNSPNNKLKNQKHI